MFMHTHNSMYLCTESIYLSTDKSSVIYHISKSIFLSFNISIISLSTYWKYCGQTHKYFKSTSPWIKESWAIFPFFLTCSAFSKLSTYASVLFNFFTMCIYWYNETNRLKTYIIYDFPLNLLVDNEFSYFSSKTTKKLREKYTNIRSYEILSDLILAPLYEVNVS